MMYTFDQRRGVLAVIGVMVDCVFSLLRQWTLRPNADIDLPAAPLRTSTSDYIPSFETLDSFQPRASAIIHGALLSWILFYMSVFAIRYSWNHVSNLHISELVAGSSTQPVGVIPSDPTGPQGKTVASKSAPARPLSRDSEKSSEHLQVDIVPTEAVDLQSKTASSSLRPAASAPPRGVMILLDPYVGKYIAKYPPAKISIQIERDPISGDHLSLSLAATGHPSLALLPVSPAKFVIVGAEKSHVDFTADAEGRICCLSLVINGKVITAQRQ